MASDPTHRADIDGLRAIAVVSVLLFHAGFSSFSGGYVGVDVFFVISGYLITQIILRDLAAGQFSMARFYERRVRRIFPALAATLFVTIGVGIFLLSPYRLQKLGDSVVAVTLFVSNIIFWKTSGYFGATAEQLPLLHTWSLAVEEQFYILYPLLVLGIHRYLGGRFRLWLAVVAGVSFMLAIYLTRSDPTAAFYLAPTRAWQLLFGALLACDALSPVRTARMRDALALLGVMAIALSVMLYTPETPFPGTAALLPTLGAVLVLYAGHRGRSAVGDALGVRPVAFIGVISYSLYLVHWPVFVYARQYAIVPLSTMQSVALLALTFVLAAAMWRCVEVPFRVRGTARIRWPVSTALIAMSTAILIGVTFRTGHGPTRGGSAAALSEEPAVAAEWLRWRKCSRSIMRGEREPCTMGDPDGVPTFVVWGDSHARAIASGVNVSAINTATAGYLANADGCPPLVGMNREGLAWCAGFNSAVIAFIAARPALKTVVLSARWAAYVNGRLPGEPGGGMALHDLLQPSVSDADAAATMRIGLARTVQRLLALGREVVIVDEIPEVGYDVPTAYDIARRTGRDVNRLIAPTREAYARRTRALEPALRAVDTLAHVRRISVVASLCDSIACRIVQAGRPLYLDGHHLSAYGARQLAPAFEAVFIR